MALELRAWEEVGCSVESCNGRWRCHLGEGIDCII